MTGAAAGWYAASCAELMRAMALSNEGVAGTTPATPTAGSAVCARRGDGIRGDGELGCGEELLGLGGVCVRRDC